VKSGLGMNRGLAGMEASCDGQLGGSGASSPRVPGVPSVPPVSDTTRGPLAAGDGGFAGVPRGGVVTVATGSQAGAGGRPSTPCGGCGPAGGGGTRRGLEPGNPASGGTGGASGQGGRELELRTSGALGAPGTAGVSGQGGRVAPLAGGVAGGQGAVKGSVAGGTSGAAESAGVPEGESTRGAGRAASRSPSPEARGKPRAGVSSAFLTAVPPWGGMRAKGTAGPASHDSGTHRKRRSQWPAAGRGRANPDHRATRESLRCRGVVPRPRSFQPGCELARPPCACLPGYSQAVYRRIRRPIADAAGCARVIPDSTETTVGAARTG
jgi:hypothetical protein